MQTCPIIVNNAPCGKNLSIGHIVCIDHWQLVPAKIRSQFFYQSRQQHKNWGSLNPVESGKTHNPIAEKAIRIVQAKVNTKAAQDQYDKEDKEPDDNNADPFTS